MTIGIFIPVGYPTKKVCSALRGNYVKEKSY